MNGPLLRLFLAFPCPLPAAEALAAWSAIHCPAGRTVHPADMHITLAFLGNQPAERVPFLAGLLSDLPLPEFRLELGIPQLWKDLLVLLPERTPDPLITFHALLLARLERAGLPIERRPYRPHLTLARRVTRPPITETCPPIAWQVQEWGLYRSLERQPRYQQLERWTTVSTSNSPSLIRPQHPKPDDLDA